MAESKFIVHIWRNIKKHGKIPTSHFGHASVKILEGRFPGGQLHVSFWPGDGAGKGLSAIRKQQGATNDNLSGDTQSEIGQLTALRLEVGYRQKHNIPYPAIWDQMLREYGKTPLSSPRQGQWRNQRDGRLVTQHMPLDEDGYTLWHQSPEVNVIIPALGADTDRPLGLITIEAYNWWARFLQTNPKYQALGYQNCAGVALMCLQAAGSEAFVPLPKVYIYTEPRQVEDYAKLLKSEIDRWNDFVLQLRNDVNQFVAAKALGPTPDSELSCGIWPLETWKQKSALGPLQPRSSTIRAIDDAVKDFHLASTNQTAAGQLKAVMALIKNIMAHRQAKPDSARSEAIIRLAAQALSAAR